MNSYNISIESIDNGYIVHYYSYNTLDSDPIIGPASKATRRVYQTADEVKEALVEFASDLQ